MSQEAPLLEVTDLQKYYRPRRRSAEPVKAVDGVSFTIGRGETLGLVGESGSGKSSLANAVLMLDRPTGGTVTFGGEDLTAMSPRQLRGVRRRLQAVFQDPYSSLNGRMTVAEIVGEPLVVHRLVTSSAGRAAAVSAALDSVGLSSRDATRYPHEFSGGQRQRIGIARAIVSSPELIVCDEPVSALDVSVQAQVINLLLDLQADRGLSYLFISHDLSVVSALVNRVAVMYKGHIVEMGPTRDVFAAPKDEYTRRLLDAVPARRR